MAIAADTYFTKTNNGHNFDGSRQVKRRTLVIAIIFGCAWVAGSATAFPTRTTLREVRALGNTAGTQPHPVEFEATVTYFRGYEKTLFVEDDNVALFVLATTKLGFVPGDRVLVKGTIRGSFHPIVVSDDITLLRHGAVPKSHAASFSELISGQRDCDLVTVRGVVHAADLVASSVPPMHNTTLQLLTDGGYVDVTLDTDNTDSLIGLLDAEVEVTGVAGGKFDGKMQQTGVLIHTLSLASIKILKRASADLWTAPVAPMSAILSGYRVRDFTQRVRVQGTVTYYQPGSVVVLQNGNRSLWIRTLTHNPLRIGDLADASGFPDVIDGFLTLTRSEIRDDQIQAPVAPRLVSWQQLAVNGNLPVGHHYDLVSIEGEVVMAGSVAAQDEYILVTDGHPFSAIYRHLEGPSANMKKIPLGSKIRVTGICTLDDANPFNRTVPFEILLRSFDDIAVVARPSLLNIRNLILVVCALVLVVFVTLARGWTLERKVRRQTAASAHLEQWRSRILEDINGTRPLAEIVEESTKLVSFKLQGAPCWCQIADGALLGNCPPNLTSLRVVQQEIPSHSGPALGTVFVAFDPARKPSAVESEALSMAVGLATLAIDTRRLYSDLLHRSEFDQLTDIHNRFSLGKRLGVLIDEARANAGILGLIYIDLDGFKQVNDLYGHHIGDIYLQEVAQRMKQQLRPHDLLARLGGDEFAVLLPMVRNRAGVEEIAQRLETCFDDPLVLEGQILQGAASFGIALYPENSTTGDGLLSAADSAMYAAKNSRKLAASRTA
jgi:diguanylate cyclase (GGDEF)-like protein